MTVLDADGDGAISAAEIAGAPAALLPLDKNDDGSLTVDEMTPTFGRGGRGRPLGPRKQPHEIDPEDALPRVSDRETFQRLSYQGREVMIDTALTGLEFVKFVVADLETEKPVVYFMNTKRHRAHMMFTQIAGIPRGRGGSAGSMMGVLVYRPLLDSSLDTPGLYTFEFEPEDSYPIEHVATAFNLVSEFAPVTKGRLSYHVLPGSRARFDRERVEYESRKLPFVLPENLFADVAFLPLNEATGFGRLRIMQPGERPGARDIVVYDALPSEMPRTAGVVTTVRQTPLSHVNLRAVQDGVPNAFIKDATSLEQVVSLAGRYVRYAVAADGFTLIEATTEQVEQHFVALRPETEQQPVRDLSVLEPRRLDDIKFADSKSFGVKVANVAAMRSMDLPQGMVPNGYGVPFHFYDTFMERNGLYDAARAMLDDSKFASDVDHRQQELGKLRKQIKKAAMPKSMSRALAEILAAYPEGQPLRCRSSTNAEDLPGFSGAGLYDSFTHRPNEGKLDKSIRQVFASLWNFRAYEEREFHRIDHFTTAMGVLIHPNFDDEQANGVAVTDDIVYQTRDQNSGRRYYINVQVGEELVTNPDQALVPEEWLLHPRYPNLDMFVRASSLKGEGKRVLLDWQTDELRDALLTIDAEFRKLYAVERDQQFAVDVEFKVDKGGELAIKQARPWLY